jgi:DNA-binding LytR/AlgR family response regulator
MSLLTLYDPLCIPAGSEGFTFIDPGSIIYVEAADKYSHIYCVDKVVYKTISLTLQEVYHRLPRRVFLRVHKSSLVSRLHILKMNPAKTRIYCTDDITVPIGRTYQPDFLKRFRMGGGQGGIIIQKYTGI